MKKLWYYSENYGTFIYNKKYYGAVEKTVVLDLEKKNNDTMGKTRVLWKKIC